MPSRHPYTRVTHWLGRNKWIVCAAIAAACLASAAHASVVRAPLSDDAYALLRDGRSMFLECRVPDGPAGKAYLSTFLAAGVKWEQYAGRGRAIPFKDLNDETQRLVLLAVFPFDFVDEEGWHHTVIYAGQDQETLWTLCEWLTGRGTSHKDIQKINNLASTQLTSGQVLVFPHSLLRDVMKKPTVIREESLEAELNLEEAASELRYETRRGDSYAVYTIKPGDTLYTKVVVRFTNFRENLDIHAAIDVLVKESNIKDKNKIEIGDKIFIPMDMLADRFKPEGDPERQEFEESIQEAQRLRGSVQSKGLEGVVVVLDPGHGGKDIGTPAGVKKNMYEDEVAYDIVCRVKKILEETTQAKVYVTMLDRDSGYTPRDVRTFNNENNEVVLTTPNYLNEDAKVSASLRWYLANSIYRKEIKQGTDARKIVFTSFHGDALFNSDLRGAMIYIPGARYRDDKATGWPPKAMQPFAEYKEQPEFRTNAEERKRDEALSRNFAETTLDELGKHRIKRHDVGDPIRNVIRQSNGSEYVVAVLAKNAIPTKVLIEMANLNNDTDLANMADPWWRQQFALAYVQALKTYFGS